MRTWPAIDVERLSVPDLLQAALSDYDVAAIDERSPHEWRVFFQNHWERDRAAAALPGAFPDLSIAPVDVPDEDWAARSQASLQAVRIGQIIVAPPWDVPEQGSSGDSATPVSAPMVIVIQPSLGFGTGHHATTRLCLAALQQVAVKGTTVVDVGTGSGVLAIAASRLGAVRVVALDDDPDATQAARENVARNHTVIDIQTGDVRSLALSRFDLVLANLTGGLLMQAAPRFQEIIARRGRMILSGFTVDEEPAVVAAYPHLRLVDRGQEDEWVSITMQGEGAFE